MEGDGKEWEGREYEGKRREGERKGEGGGIRTPLRIGLVTGLYYVVLCVFYGLFVTFSSPIMAVLKAIGVKLSVIFEFRGNHITACKLVIRQFSAHVQHVLYTPDENKTYVRC